MKSVFLIALLAITFSANSFAADENKVSSVVLRSFRIDFKDAANVTWTTRTDYAKAAFTLNHQKMEAFYNIKGDVIAISKNIRLDELPVSAKRAFAKRYENYTVKEAIKFDGMEESAYYISADNEKESVILKVNENEDLSIFKRTKKVAG